MKKLLTTATLLTITPIAYAHHNQTEDALIFALSITAIILISKPLYKKLAKAKIKK